jgi:hypothetical protein
MNKLLMSAIAAFVLCTTTIISCTAPTQIVSSWRDPNVTITNPSPHKIVVAALIYDQGVRRQVEDYMASLYPGLASPSYTVLGGDSLLSNEAAATLSLKKLGYDGIVIMRQVTENSTQRWVPGQFPSYYNTWGGYWGGGWGGPRWGATFYNPGTPGHFAVDRTWTVQVNAYSLDPNKLVYAANTHTTDPGGRVPLFIDVCNAVHKQMQADKFLQ